jgi:hypothetical protein
MHACHFYGDRDQLVAALVPYFIAGLRGNECCLWVAAPPLPAREAVRALRAAWDGADDAIQTGALRILDFGHWYTSPARLKEPDVVEVWLKEEERALAESYNGLRIAGNMSFLEPGNWPALMEHEQAVTARFNGRRIVALCSYALSQCNDRQMSEVMRTHHCAFERSDADWQVAAVSRVPGLRKQVELIGPEGDSEGGVSREGGVAATQNVVPAMFAPGPTSRRRSLSSRRET